MDVNYNMQSGTSISLADIAETGNGYIKFSNGIMIQHGKYTISCNKTTAGNNIIGIINFTKSFISPPKMILSISKSINMTYSDLIKSSGTTGMPALTYASAIIAQNFQNNVSIRSMVTLLDEANIHFVSTSDIADGYKIYCDMICIGRWK